MNPIDELDHSLKKANQQLKALEGTIYALKQHNGYEAIMTLVRQQLQTIEDLRQEVTTLQDANRGLRHERDEFESKWRWHFYDEELAPEDIRDFLIDIGLEPAYLTKMSLGDRMAIRDRLQTFK